MSENRKRRGAARRGVTEPVTLSGISALLPGFNCRDCGYTDCSDFALALAEKKAGAEACRFLAQARFEDNKNQLEKLLGGGAVLRAPAGPVGVVDGLVADFVLKPLPGECSCREILYPFYRREYRAGDFVRYRPLGCPLPHFARVIDESKGLITVHIVGPRHGTADDGGPVFEDIGVCMVGGFIGVVEGQRPKVCQTVRFIPDGCMMQKVHTGVVVQLENGRAVIEGIDLKVWGLPEQA
jgi:uncharacterized Fe-S cluster-containing protein